MTREEAIETIRRCCPKVGDSQCDFESAMRELIPELRESKDERIRKGLIETLKTSKTVGELKFILPEPTREECIVYLEKQKGKEIPKWMPKFLDELRSKKHYFDWDEHRDIEGSILAIIDFIAPDYFTEKDKKEQKSAEWSEEDKEWLSKVYYAIDNSRYSGDEKREMKKYIKSLRPSWRPSNEQMYILNWVANILLNHDGIVEEEVSKKLQSLYNDLKKLM